MLLEINGPNWFSASTTRHDTISATEGQELRIPWLFQTDPLPTKAVKILPQLVQDHIARSERSVERKDRMRSAEALRYKVIEQSVEQKQPGAAR